VLELSDERVEMLGKLSDFVLGLDRQALGQIPLALGNVLEQFRAIPDRQQDRPTDQQGDAEADHEKDQGRQADHPPHLVDGCQHVVLHRPHGNGPACALDGRESEEPVLAHERVLVKPRLAPDHALKHVRKTGIFRIGLSLLEEIALIEHELPVAVRDQHALVIDDVGISRLAVLDLVRDLAEQGCVQSGQEDGPHFLPLPPDRGGDDDDRRIGDPADDDIGKNGLPLHGLFEIIPVAQRRCGSVGVAGLAVRGDDAHAQIFHAGSFILQGRALHIPIHGADHVAVGDPFDDDEMIVQAASDQSRSVLSHEHDVLLHLAERGLLGPVVGNKTQAGANQNQQGQKTSDQLHANWDFLHHCLQYILVPDTFMPRNFGVLRTDARMAKNDPAAV